MEYCLGTAQLGMKYGIQGGDPIGENAALEILAAAYRGGIRAFDTAIAYGKAEERLGRFIRGSKIDRGKLTIVSKILPASSFTKPFDTWGSMASSVERSLAELGTSYLDGLMLHNAQLLDNKNAIAALIRLKREGYAKYIGVSIYTPTEALSALNTSAIDIMQVPYNVLDRRLDKVNFFEKASARKIVVYARSVLLQGLLTMPLEEVPVEIAGARETVREFHDICIHNEISPFKAAVLYVKARRGIDYLTFGVDSLPQLQDYLGIGQEEIGEDLLAELENSFSNIDPYILMPNLWRLS